MADDSNMASADEASEAPLPVNKEERVRELARRRQAKSRKKRRIEDVKSVVGDADTVAQLTPKNLECRSSRHMPKQSNLFEACKSLHAELKSEREENAKLRSEAKVTQQRLGQVGAELNTANSKYGRLDELLREARLKLKKAVGENETLKREHERELAEAKLKAKSEQREQRRTSFGEVRELNGNVRTLNAKYEKANAQVSTLSSLRRFVNGDGELCIIKKEQLTAGAKFTLTPEYSQAVLNAVLDGATFKGAGKTVSDTFNTLPIFLEGERMKVRFLNRAFDGELTETEQSHVPVETVVRIVNQAKHVLLVEIVKDLFRPGVQWGMGMDGSSRHGRREVRYSIEIHIHGEALGAVELFSLLPKRPNETTEDVLKRFIETVREIQEFLGWPEKDRTVWADMRFFTSDNAKDMAGEKKDGAVAVIERLRFESFQELVHRHEKDPQLVGARGSWFDPIKFAELIRVGCLDHVAALGGKGTEKALVEHCQRNALKDFLHTTLLKAVRLKAVVYVKLLLLTATGASFWTQLWEDYSAELQIRFTRAADKRYAGVLLACRMFFRLLPALFIARHTPGFLTEQATKQLDQILRPESILVLNIMASICTIYVLPLMSAGAVIATIEMAAMLADGIVPAFGAVSKLATGTAFDAIPFEEFAVNDRCYEELDRLQLKENVTPFGVLMHRANTIHYAEPDLEHPNIAVRALVDSSDVRPGPALVREGDARAQVVIDQTEEEKVGKHDKKENLIGDNPLTRNSDAADSVAILVELMGDEDVTDLGDVEMESAFDADAQKALQHELAAGVLANFSRVYVQYLQRYQTSPAAAPPQTLVAADLPKKMTGTVSSLLSQKKKLLKKRTGKNFLAGTNRDGETAFGKADHQFQRRSEDLRPALVDALVLLSSTKHDTSRLFLDADPRTFAWSRTRGRFQLDNDLTLVQRQREMETLRREKQANKEARREEAARFRVRLGAIANLNHWLQHFDVEVKEGKVVTLAQLKALGSKIIESYRSSPLKDDGVVVKKRGHLPKQDYLPHLERIIACHEARIAADSTQSGASDT